MELCLYTPGHFGVGLSACLLYSLMNVQEPMRIISKRNDKLEAVVADFVLSDDHMPVVSQEIKVIIPKFQSGTFSDLFTYIQMLVLRLCVANTCSLYFYTEYCTPKR